MSDDLGKVTTRIKVTNWLGVEVAAAGARRETPGSIEAEAVLGPFLFGASASLGRDDS